MIVDALAQISVFLKLKLQNRARPETAPGFLLRIRTDLNRANEFSPGSAEPRGHCMAQAPASSRSIVLGLYYQWLARRRHAFLLGCWRLDQPSPGTRGLFFFLLFTGEQAWTAPLR
jgi:hypothetical protein